MIYADIASGATRLVVLMGAAGLIGLMTTTLSDLDARANTFVGVRGVPGDRGARLAAHRAPADPWPAVQLGGLSAVWIASIWVDPPAKF